MYYFSLLNSIFNNDLNHYHNHHFIIMLCNDIIIIMLQCECISSILVDKSQYDIM